MVIYICGETCYSGEDLHPVEDMHNMDRMQLSNQPVQKINVQVCNSHALRKSCKFDESIDKISSAFNVFQQYGYVWFRVAKHGIFLVHLHKLGPRIINFILTV